MAASAAPAGAAMAAGCGGPRRGRNKIAFGRPGGPADNLVPDVSPGRWGDWQRIWVQESRKETHHSLTRLDVQELIGDAVCRVERAVAQLVMAQTARVLGALEHAGARPSPGRGVHWLAPDLAEDLAPGRAAPAPPPQTPRAEPEPPPPPGFALQPGGGGAGPRASSPARAASGARRCGGAALSPGVPPEWGASSALGWLAAPPSPGMLVRAAQVRAETREAQARTVAEAEEAQALRSAAEQAGPRRARSRRQRWHQRNAYFVGSLPVVEKATSMSVHEAVDALNSGALRVATPWLLIYSASHGGWWVVYQNGYQDAATKIFECARALPASFS